MAVVSSGCGPEERKHRFDEESTAIDVLNAHRTFFGRLLEDDRVSTLLGGQSRLTIVIRLLKSEEFNRMIIPGLRKGIGLEDRHFGEPVDHSLESWAAGFFNLEYESFDVNRPGLTGAELLAACLMSSGLRQSCDALHPPGTAEALAAAAAAFVRSPPNARRPEVGATSREDLVNCYRFFLGRDPESDDVVRSRPDTPVAETAAGFILSAEFREKVLIPGLAERFTSRPKLGVELRKWVSETFGPAEPQLTLTANAIAAVLRQPKIAHHIQDRHAFWPSGPLAAALTRADMSSVESLVNHISSGIELLDVVGIRRDSADRRVHFTTDTPHIEFKLSGAAATSEVVLLRLGSSARDVGPSRLNLDYGSGFSESDSILLRSETEGRPIEVVLAAAHKLHSLRWNPVDRRSTGVVTLLTARPFSVEEVTHRLQGAFEGPTGPLRTILTAAAEDPGANVAVSLSRAMSPRPLKGYPAWIALNEPAGAAAVELWSDQLHHLRERPLISIIMTTYDTPLHLLNETIESVRAQVYTNWEICIADDGSTNPAIVKFLRQYEKYDPRIKFVLHRESRDVSEASNSALALVTGEWTARLEHDDILRPNALLALAVELNNCPHAELIFSDEDSLEGFDRCKPYFKPDYSPELLLTRNYFNHLTAHRTANVRAVGGWRREFEGSQDYDLILRIIERIRPEQIRHIPEVLYHSRAVEGSTALSTSEKSSALDAGLRALQEHLHRTRPGSRAERLIGAPFYRVRPAAPTPAPLVSLIIPTRDKPDLLRAAIKSIRELSTYPSYEIVVVNNNSEDSETYELFDELSADNRIQIVDFGGSFNYSAINNYAARMARGTIFGLLNNDVEIISPDWMEEMVA